MASLLKGGRGGYSMFSMYSLFRNVKADINSTNIRSFFSQDCLFYKVAGIIGNSSDRLPDDQNANLRDDEDNINGRKREKMHLNYWQRRDARFSEFAKTHKSLTVDEWQQEKSNFPNCDNFESQLMHWCASQSNLSLGRSLMGFMKASSVAPNLVTLSKYLRLLGDYRVDNWECVEEEELLSLFTKIVDGTQMILDAGTAEDLVHGICSTNRWREAIPLIDTIQQTCKGFNIATLLSVVLAAFRHHEFELGWEFMEKAATDRNKPLLDSGFKEWMKMCERVPSRERQPMMDKMLSFIRKHEIFVSADVIASIKICFESCLESGWRGHLTTVSARGFCHSCNSRLEEVTLSNEEFSHLRNNFIDRVIEGKDVFLKTNPKELEHFKEFVQMTSPYKVVVDGLNVAYAMQSKGSNSTRLAKQLWSVVQHIAHTEENCKILVLGRKHMLKWPKNYLNDIKQKAFLFCVHNLSKDDPYLLYASMFSGQGTMLLSKDMMRDHLYSLHDPTLASYFRRWLRGHQMELKYIKANGEAVFKYALAHNPAAQGGGLHWHVPYDDGEPRMANEVPNTWMCLRKPVTKS